LPQLDEPTFTGREAELKQLEEQLFNQSGSRVCSIVGLSGGGGIGKTTLAYHFATIHKDKFPDGVIGFKVDGKNLYEIARKFVNECLKFSGEKVDSEEDQGAEKAAILMQETFAHRRMLLIFDGAVDPKIRHLRPGGNLCSVIITTRNRELSAFLGIPSEATIDLDPLPEEKAYQLLEKILGLERVKAESEAAYEIIRLVGCLPLALQITGKGLRDTSQRLADYRVLLQQERTRLSLLEVWGDEELNMTASLNISLERLSQDQKDFFACCSVCAEDGFAWQTAAAAAGCQNEVDARQKYLKVLSNLSLLNSAETGDNRFVFHTLVRVYARNLAKENNLLAIAQERHAKFFIEWLQSPELENIEVIPEVAESLDDVILAAQWLQNQNQESLTEQDKKERYEFILKLQPLFEENGYYEKAIKLMKTFQSWAEEAKDWNAVVKYQMHEARYLSLAEKFEEAEKIIKEAATHLKNLKSLSYSKYKKRKAKLLNVLGIIFQKQGKIEKAIRAFKEQVVIGEEIGDDKALCITYSRLGKLLLSQGQVENAQKVFEREIEVASAIQDFFELAIALGNLGQLFMSSRQFSQFKAAKRLFKQQILIAQKIQDWQGVLVGLSCLGRFFQKQRKFQEAQITFETAIKISRAKNRYLELSSFLNHLGILLKEKNKSDEAISVLEEAATLSLNFGHNQRAVGIYMILGGLYRSSGDFDNALRCFLSVVKLKEYLKHSNDLIQSLRGLAQEFHRKRKFEQALDAVNAMLSLCLAGNQKKSLAIGYHRLGLIQLSNKRIFESQDAFENEILVALDINDSSQLAIGLRSLNGLYDRLIKKSNFVDAENLLKRLIVIFHKYNSQVEVVITLNRLGKLLEKQGKLAEAQQVFEQQALINQELRDQFQISTNLKKGKMLKVGVIVFIKQNEKDNLLWGRIAPNDQSPHIHFNEKFVGSEIVSKLTKGTVVLVEWEEKSGKFYAKRIEVME
jgi:tetratricopeptide (TPR) repeat protein